MIVGSFVVYACGVVCFSGCDFNSVGVRVVLVFGCFGAMFGVLDSCGLCIACGYWSWLFLVNYWFIACGCG